MNTGNHVQPAGSFLPTFVLLRVKMYLKGIHIPDNVIK